MPTPYNDSRLETVDVLANAFLQGLIESAGNGAGKEMRYGIVRCT